MSESSITTGKDRKINTRIKLVWRVSAVPYINFLYHFSFLGYLHFGSHGVGQRVAR